MMRFLLVFLGVILATLQGAEARSDCQLASTAAMARLLGFGCRGAASPAMADRPVIPPPELRHLVELIAAKDGIEARLVLAIIAAESAFDRRAISPRNAQGLMQLLPATAIRFGVRDTFDAEDNIRGGIAYLRWLHGKFGGDLDLMLAAYNAGEGAVLATGTVPQFDETIDYIGRVKRYYRLYQQLH